MLTSLELLKGILQLNTESTAQRAEAAGKNPEQYIEDFVEEFSKDADEFLKEHQESADDYLETYQGFANTFKEESLVAWKQALNDSKVFHLLLIGMTMEVDKQAEKPENTEILTQSPLFQAAFYIHSRICQHFGGVLALLEQGFVDSAFALWRSMYEYACILIFLDTSKTQEKVARAYCKYIHEDNGTHSWARQDKRLASAKGAAVPFSRIEAMCGMSDFWDEDERPLFNHLQAHGYPKGSQSVLAPFLVQHPIIDSLTEVAECAIRTALISSHILLITLLPQGAPLIHLRILELWAEKTLALLWEADDEDFKNNYSEEEIDEAFERLREMVLQGDIKIPSIKD